MGAEAPISSSASETDGDMEFVNCTSIYTVMVLGRCVIEKHVHY